MCPSLILQSIFVSVSLEYILHGFGVVLFIGLSRTEPPQTNEMEWERPKLLLRDREIIQMPFQYCLRLCFIRAGFEFAGP